MVGRGSLKEDPYHHGSKVIPAPHTPTISENGMEEGEELGMPYTEGDTKLTGLTERRGRGWFDSGMEEGATNGRRDIMSLISSWELLNGEEGGGGMELHLPHDDDIGGRRKSQKFMDLCGQFENRISPSPNADGLVGSIQSSVDTHCSFSFKDIVILGGNGDRGSGGKIKGKIWKQRNLGLDGGLLPLVRITANKKRGGGTKVQRLRERSQTESEFGFDSSDLV